METFYLLDTVVHLASWAETSLSRVQHSNELNMRQKVSKIMINPSSSLFCVVFCVHEKNIYSNLCINPQFSLNFNYFSKYLHITNEIVRVSLFKHRLWVRKNILSSLSVELFHLGIDYDDVRRELLWYGKYVKLLTTSLT